MWSQYLIFKIRTHLDNVDSNIFNRDNYKKKTLNILESQDYSPKIYDIS